MIAANLDYHLLYKAIIGVITPCGGRPESELGLRHLTQASPKGKGDEWIIHLDLWLWAWRSSSRH